MTPPTEILKRFNIYPPSTWTKGSQQGYMADTWFQDNLVIQKRSIAGLERFEYREKVLSPVIDLDIFKGARSEVIYFDKNFFWTVSKKIAGQGVFYGKEEKDIELAFEITCQGSRDILAVKKELNKLAIIDDSEIEMINQTKMQKVSFKKVIDLNKKVFPDPAFLNELKKEPTSPKSISHGDFSIQNVIYNKNYYFIDWEQVSVLPRHADLALFAAFFLRRSDPSLWLDRIEKLFELGFGDVLGFNKNEWYQTVIGGMLRSSGYFPGTEQEIRNWQIVLFKLHDRA